jgi:hypothetical protein
MRFMTIWTWEPEQRDPMYFGKRVKEGRLAPDGVKVLNEWWDVDGGRALALVESDDVMAMFQMNNAWSNLCKFDTFPVIEVLDDKGTKWSA